MISQTTPADAQRWLPCYNAGSSEAPSHGIVCVTGVTDGVLQITTAAAGTQYAVVGPTPIPSLANGICTMEFPALALYNTADGTPANGDSWGAVAGDTSLRISKKGWRILGGVDATAGTVWVDRMARLFQGVVTQVCDTKSGGIVTSITVEKKTVGWRGITEVGAAVCTDDPADCCSTTFSTCCWCNADETPKTLFLDVTGTGSCSAANLVDGPLDFTDGFGGSTCEGAVAERYTYNAGGTGSIPNWDASPNNSFCCFVDGGIAYIKIDCEEITTCGPFQAAITSCEPFYVEIVMTVTGIGACNCSGGSGTLTFIIHE